LWLGGAATAASVLATVGISMRAGAQTFRTPRGEVRLVPLPDGSSMTLNTASEVQVAFDDHRRAVQLIEGEVFFEVARDPLRPFIVTAGHTDVRAIGTSFVVRKLQTGPVEVTVRQGEVEIVTPASLSTKVVANTRAVAAADVRAQPLRSSELARALAWREGMLSFEDVQLQKAAQEFARYSDVQIRFSDARIANETVTGLYAANNPVGFAKAIASTLGLQADVARGVVTLHR
jgi:transmembrane sensor